MKFIANSLLDIDGQRTYPGCCVELDADTATPTRTTCARTKPTNSPQLRTP